MRPWTLPSLFLLALAFASLFSFSRSATPSPTPLTPLPQITPNSSNVPIACFLLLPLNDLARLDCFHVDPSLFTSPSSGGMSGMSFGDRPYSFSFPVFNATKSDVVSTGGTYFCFLVANISETACGCVNLSILSGPDAIKVVNDCSSKGSAAVKVAVDPTGTHACFLRINSADSALLLNCNNFAVGLVVESNTAKALDGTETDLALELATVYDPFRDKLVCFMASTLTERISFCGHILDFTAAAPSQFSNYSTPAPIALAMGTETPVTAYIIAPNLNWFSILKFDWDSENWTLVTNVQYGQPVDFVSDITARVSNNFRVLCVAVSSTLGFRRTFCLNEILSVEIPIGFRNDSLSSTSNDILFYPNGSRVCFIFNAPTFYNISCTALSVGATNFSLDVTGTLDHFQLEASPDSDRFSYLGTGPLFLACELPTNGTGCNFYPAVTQADAKYTTGLVPPTLCSVYENNPLAPTFAKCSFSLSSPRILVSGPVNGLHVATGISPTSNFYPKSESLCLASVNGNTFFVDCFLIDTYVPAGLSTNPIASYQFSFAVPPIFDIASGDGISCFIFAILSDTHAMCLTPADNHLFSYSNWQGTGSIQVKVSVAPNGKAACFLRVLVNQSVDHICVLLPSFLFLPGIFPFAPQNFTDILGPFSQNLDIAVHENNGTISYVFVVSWTTKGIIYWSKPGQTSYQNTAGGPMLVTLNPDTNSFYLFRPRSTLSSANAYEIDLFETWTTLPLLIEGYHNFSMIPNSISMSFSTNMDLLCVAGSSSIPVRPMRSLTCYSNMDFSVPRVNFHSGITETDLATSSEVIVFPSGGKYCATFDHDSNPQFSYCYTITSPGSFANLSAGGQKNNLKITRDSSTLYQMSGNFVFADVIKYDTSSYTIDGITSIATDTKDIDGVLSGSDTQEFCFGHLGNSSRQLSYKCFPPGPISNGGSYRITQVDSFKMVTVSYYPIFIPTPQPTFSPTQSPSPTSPPTLSSSSPTLSSSSPTLSSSTSSPIFTSNPTPSNPNPSPVSLTPTPSGCGSQPGPNFTCTNRTWILNSSITIDTGVAWISTIQLNGNLTIAPQVTLNLSSVVNIDGTLTLDSNSNISLSPSASLFVTGDLVISSTSTLEIGGTSQLNISNCLTIEPGGSLVVNVSGPGSYNVLNYSCINGNFSRLETSLSTSNCEKVSVRPNYTATQLQIAVDLTPKTSSECSTKEPSGLRQEYIIAIAAVGAVLVVLAIILAILFGVPSIRQRVFPHRFRETWSKSKPSSN